MTRLFNNIKLLNVLKIPVRYKNPSHHWSVLRKKTSSCEKALDHFDDFYESVYGTTWKVMRSALLQTDHKYVAIINNFSDTKRICDELEVLGAMNLEKIYQASKKNLELQTSLRINETDFKEIEKSNKTVENIITEKKIEHAKYLNTYEDPNGDCETVNNDDINSFKPIKLQSIEKDINKVNDSRLIEPSYGVTPLQFHEFVPATKLKGLDDFVLESEHYNYYNKGSDFTIKIIEEDELNFPRNLLMYTFEENNFTKFPRSKTGSTDVSDYFVLDGASILPILSLDLQPGDSFLDMCGAPGGKTLMAIQTLCPRLIVSNDIQLSRMLKINDFIDEFIPDIGDWRKKVFVTQSDARLIEDKDIYNKILVDVPCTTDRHVLHKNDNNIFKPSRIRERLRLPELQTEILTNALKLVQVGGTVVYSTCSLSPIQNDGVVQMALKKAFEDNQTVCVVKNQSRALDPLQFLYSFGDFALKYGHIVIPTKSRNWGPLYFCKMIRVQ